MDVPYHLLLANPGFSEIHREVSTNYTRKLADASTVTSHVDQCNAIASEGATTDVGLGC